jgi:hypothetical protein
MQRILDQFDREAEAEANAIKNSYKPHTIDFGIRKRKNSVSPDQILHQQSRKAIRHRATKQRDLRKERMERLWREVKIRIKREKEDFVPIQL